MSATRPEDSVWDDALKAGGKNVLSGETAVWSLGVGTCAFLGPVILVDTPCDPSVVNWSNEGTDEMSVWSEKGEAMSVEVG